MKASPPWRPSTTTRTGPGARRSTASRARSSDDLGEGGWLGLSIPEEYGGGGQGLLELAVANETLCASGGTEGTFFYVTTPGFGAMTLTRHGNEEQKQRILPGMARATSSSASH